MDSCVEAKDIRVIGASKGAFIAQLDRARLNNPEIR